SNTQSSVKRDTLIQAHSIRSVAKTPKPGDQISDYQVIKKLGEGGMGTVFQCLDPLLQRQVAIKLLRSEYSHKSDFRTRFEIEARAVAQLRHPNIVQVFRAGEDPQTQCLFFAMDFIEGQGLEDLVKQKKRLPAKKALKYLQHITEGLKYSHEKNILHRDIKPANILISKEDQALLADFGLAKIIGSTEALLSAETSPANESSKNIQLTQMGSIMGTPLYMAPERIDGVNDDKRSDIYALGMVFYFCLTGQKPFEKAKITHILDAQKNEEPQPIELFASDCPPALIQIFKKATAKRREDRFQNMEELLQSIQAIEKNKQRERELYEKKKLSAVAVASMEKEKSASLVWLKYLFSVLVIFGTFFIFYQFTKVPLVSNTQTTELLTRAIDQQWKHQQETRLAGTFTRQEKTADGKILLGVHTHFNGLSWSEEKWIEFSEQEWNSIIEEYKLSLNPGDYVAFTGKAIVQGQENPYLDGHFSSYLALSEIRYMHRKQENTTPDRLKKFSEKLNGEIVQAIGKILFIEETPEGGLTLFIGGSKKEYVMIMMSKTILEQVEAHHYSPRVGDSVHAIGTLSYEGQDDQLHPFWILLEENRPDNFSLAQ
ncbi:MAG: protein kinase, partial [Planctomycetota bacterium]